MANWDWCTYYIWPSACLQKPNKFQTPICFLCISDSLNYNNSLCNVSKLMICVNCEGDH